MANRAALDSLGVQAQSDQLVPLDRWAFLGQLETPDLVAEKVRLESQASQAVQVNQAALDSKAPQVSQGPLEAPVDQELDFPDHPANLEPPASQDFLDRTEYLAEMGILEHPDNKDSQAFLVQLDPQVTEARLVTLETLDQPDRRVLQDNQVLVSLVRGVFRVLLVCLVAQACPVVPVCPVDLEVQDLLVPLVSLDCLEIMVCQVDLE
jgi:hypothetical protein